MLYILTGVRGAGKTTQVDRIKSTNIGQVLQPSTTRPPRFEGESEYDFVETWYSEKYAWSIDVGEYKYGMRKSEIQRAATAPAFTVFEPIAIDTFYDFRDRSGVSACTIGLDTVADLAEQVSRVKNAGSRIMTIDQFNLAQKKVREADVVLVGDEEEVFAKISAILSAQSSPPST
ncbi:hypothetical protein C6558_35220 [Ensifer sp. NM-2]|uniref:hypothetical protein n=1 Tax=Ensifer sp. NM-2 TaxID=2109730 RepID=UPI000D12D402|nr:hypothetical protein [Ensifer sp. NM-2]PSS59951.1 hypothetical protein C6558_35220 [Ensifer sp. NM-2]